VCNQVNFCYEWTGGEKGFRKPCLFACLLPNKTSSDARCAIASDGFLIWPHHVWCILCQYLHSSATNRLGPGVIWKPWRGIFTCLLFLQTALGQVWRILICNLCHSNRSEAGVKNIHMCFIPIKWVWGRSEESCYVFYCSQMGLSWAWGKLICLLFPQMGLRGVWGICISVDFLQMGLRWGWGIFGCLWFLANRFEAGARKIYMSCISIK